VGIVGNENQGQLDEPVKPTLYPAFAQDVDSYMFFAVRTTPTPDSLVSPIHEILRAIDPELPLIGPAPMERLVAQSPAVFLRKFPSFLIGSFAGLALVLAMVGLYGLVSYSVSRRTRRSEFAWRWERSAKMCCAWCSAGDCGLRCSVSPPA
jgi:hypothetical protein